MIQVYATGCGPTQPQVPDSQPPTGPASATATVKAYVSVLEAPVQYAGAHPQFPDICQVNAMVPNAAYITGQVPVVITVNGIPSNQVTAWIE